MDFYKQWASRFLVPDGPQTDGEEPAPPQTSEFEITLPASHPLCALRDFYSGGSNPASLSLRLECGSDASFPFSDKVLSRETEALTAALSRIASKRIRQMFPDAAQTAPADLDETAFLYLSNDSMAAWLLLLPASGQGQPLRLEQLEQTLTRRGVLYGVDQRLLRQLPTLPQRHFRLFPIAYGADPAPGEDGRIVDRYPRTIQASTQVDELAHADYVTLNLVQDICQGEVICEIIPPTPGVSGNTVTGKLIPAVPGKAAEIPQGRNTAVSEDGRYLLATRHGHVEFTGYSFQVKPILDIEGDVGRSNGTVNFLGDIHIHGDVYQGAVIRAMGNIQIDGVIEDCSIEAGENLVVSSGVQGQERAVIRANKSIYAKYLEHCCAYAQESIQSDCIIDCNVYSNGTVKVRTGRGAIIGGHIRASRSVTANTVGSKAERNTSITLGGLPCEDFERQQIMADIEKTAAEIRKLEARPDAADHESRLSKLRLNLYVAQMKLEKADKARAPQLPPQPSNDRRCLICDAAYPGTVVTIDHKSFRISRVEQPCSIGLVNGLVGRISCSGKEVTP